MGYLRDSRITSARYFMILLLVAHDPEEEIKTSVSLNSTLVHFLESNLLNEVF